MNNDTDTQDWLAPQAEAAIAGASRMASATSWTEALDASGRLVVYASSIIGALNNANDWQDFSPSQMQGVRAAEAVCLSIRLARGEMSRNLKRWGGLTALLDPSQDAADFLALNRKLNRLLSGLTEASNRMVRRAQAEDAGTAA